MFFERLNAWLGTLHVRLALWNAGAVLVTGVAVLFGLREAVRYALIHEMDQVLIEDVAEVVLALESRAPEDPALQKRLNEKAFSHKQHQWFAQILDDHGTSLWSTLTIPADLPPLAAMQLQQPESVGHFRLFEGHTTMGRPLSVRVGSRIDFVDDDLRLIDRLVMVIAGVVLLVAPLGGYWLAGRAIEPLADMIALTEQLRPRKLHMRLPVRQTGDELDRLAATINGLVDRIADYLEREQDFLANAAHELRTPLAAIRSSVEVALAVERTREEYQELLAELLNEVEFLEVLVNQLLFLAETDADRLQTLNDFVDLREVAGGSVEMFNGVSEHRDIKLTFKPGPAAIVQGNRHHLRQVINNLLDNALKFTPSGGNVRLELNTDEHSRRVQLRVIDTGSGIPPDDLPLVFERFFRGDKSRFREGVQRGTGLGLSICRAVIAAHGGMIEATSEVGVGTTFTIHLPLADRSAVPNKEDNG